MAQLHCRRKAAKRLPGGDPLSPAERALGCERAYPRTYRLTLTPKMIAAGRDAAEHVLAHDLSPIVDIDLLRALWRCGAHELAVQLARLAGAA